jgi:hypothetical protein
MIRQIGPIRPMKATTLLHPCRCQLFAVAAFVDKRTLQPGNLLIQQIIGLVDQADERIGDHCGVLVV